MADVDIHAGAFWLGPGPEPSAVDPRLPVDLRFPDWDGQTVTVLRYDQLGPAARGAYLMWLATGRRAPQAPSCWAALYLLGLERRIVHDGDPDPALLAEIRALHAIYGRADPAVATLAVGIDQPPYDVPPPPLRAGAADVPSELLVELGRRVLAGRPLTAEWALAWAWYHPGVALQDAARQVPDEFSRLWRHRFDERYPEGLHVPPRRRRLVLDYRPANPTLPRPLERTVADASDVFDHPGPVQVLREITDGVERELAAFARMAARGPVHDTVEAAALLPDPLLNGSAAGAAVEPFVGWATGRLADREPVRVTGHELTAQWSGATDRSGTLAMIRILERHGVGVEPDVRFGGHTIPDDDSAVVLFPTGDGATSTPSPAYVVSAVMTELCLAVASADGTVDDSEVALLVDRIDRMDDLTDGERRRLAAHRMLVGERPIDLDEAAVRAGALPEQARRDLARTVVDVALADGVVADDERRVVESVHGLLGVEFSDSLLDGEAPESVAPPDDDAVSPEIEIGAGPGASSTPGTESETRRPDPEVVQPAPDPHPAPVAAAAVVPDVVVPAPRSVSLDGDRLARTQASNADVRALLGAIFEDEDGDDDGAEDEAAPASATEPEPTGKRIGSLDVRHSCLLSELADAGSCSRSELERVCARLAVLPDGALDVVNEASYDAVGDPVIELMDDGSVAVDVDVLEEMRA